ncbi:MAG: class II aldolase/adducin family protein [Ignavibacteriae bacterium]|nr:class II aldolase/adducin family protein [Ignavibacteriota bacterium]
MISSEITTQLVDVCHRLYARNMVTATDGNVSVRLSNGNILTTRSGINKGMITQNDFVEVTLAGEKVGGNGKASTEVAMHLYVYHHRPDVNAVVHAHPTYATGFATARIPLTQCTFPEVIVGLGAIPLAEYATPSTMEVPESLAPFIKNSDAILLANHGAVTYAATLYDAYFKMEKVEHAAHITFVARMLGGAKPLSSDDLEKLRTVSVQSYGKDFSDKIACTIPDSRDDEISETTLRTYVLESLRKHGIT